MLATQDWRSCAKQLNPGGELSGNQGRAAQAKTVQQLPQWYVLPYAICMYSSTRSSE